MGSPDEVCFLCVHSVAGGRRNKVPSLALINGDMPRQGTYHWHLVHVLPCIQFLQNSRFLDFLCCATAFQTLNEASHWDVAVVRMTTSSISLCAPEPITLTVILQRSPRMEDRAPSSSVEPFPGHSSPLSWLPQSRVAREGQSCILHSAV